MVHMEHELPHLSFPLRDLFCLLIKRGEETRNHREREREREVEMFLSNNSSISLNNNTNNNCIDQQPMFDRPFFINDVSPSSKMYPAPLPFHDQYSSSFSHTFNSDHHHHQNSSAADDQDFIAAFLQQHQEDLLVGHQFSHIQQPNTSTTTTSSISKQTRIITTTTDHQTNWTHLNNMFNMDDEMISNKINVDDHGGGGGISCRREPAVTLWKKKQTSSTTSKKDRHSKIVTAQGPRDRRMRLSLEIARRFFTLQDMLGFDKASKTVEWLLTKSKGAIKELTKSIKGSSNNTSGGGGSSTSECEVVSMFDHTPNVDDDEDENKVQISNTISSNPKEKRVRVTRKPKFHPPPLGKDSRAKARARARERTIEKMWSRSMAPFPHNLNQLRANSTSYETGGEESGSQSHDMSLEMVAEVEDHPPAAAARSSSLECQGPIGEEYSFVITRNSPTTTTTTTTTKSPLFFDYNHEIKTSQGLNLNNNNCNFPENWDIDSAVEHTLAIPSQTACIYQQQVFNLSASHGSHS